MLHPQPYTSNPRQPFPKRVGNRDRSVPAPGAADAYRQVSLAFADVLRNQELEQVQRVIEEFVRRAGPIQIPYDVGVASGMRAKSRHEMGFRQKPDIEQQIRIDRDAVLEPEAQDRDDELRAGGASGRDT